MSLLILCYLLGFLDEVKSHAHFPRNSKSKRQKEGMESSVSKETKKCGQQYKPFNPHDLESGERGCVVFGAPMLFLLLAV